MQEISTNPTFKSTVPNSTLPKEKEISIIKTTIPIFSTTYTSLINKELETIITETPSETELITIEKQTETEVIQTEKSTENEVININTVITSDNVNTNEASEIQRTSASVILLGYSDFTYSDINNMIFFLIHFATIRGVVFSKNLKIIIVIIYKKSLRRLKNIDKEVNCLLIRFSI